MMDLWWRIGGYLRVRLTGADLARSLRELAALQLRMDQIEFCSDLTVEFSVARWQYGILEAYQKKNGLTMESVQRRGGPEIVKGWLRRPLLVLVLISLLGASIYIPSRIFFIRVEGNQTIPTRLILEMAERCGVEFGASRRELRSEQVKNQLLSDIPELSWVGVNTRGCVATITVQERQLQEEAQQAVPGNIVAIRDAVVDEITVTSGTNVCVVGQAVREGQVLVSGYTDLGICTRVEEAQAEVYGLTQRTVEAVLPEKATVRGEQIDSKRKISLIFGKNRINLYSDSGILQGSCGKMTQVKQLVLPGGWELPVYLVVETYTQYGSSVQSRSEAGVEDLLLDAAERHTREAMVAGSILDVDAELTLADGRYQYVCGFSCRELIGKQSHGVYLEGDAKDDGTNRERGAG